MTTVGIIGVGHLIKHLMPALVQTGHRIVLSARSVEVVRDLQSRFALEVSEDLQSIVDQADIVMLAVRPFQAMELCSGLEFRDEQIVLSLCAGLALSELGPVVSPADAIRAMPVIAAEYGESPTLLWPDDAACRELLEPCGPVLATRDEAEFEPASVVACYFGWVQHLVGEIDAWSRDNGVSPDVSRHLVAQMTRAAGTLVGQRTETSVAQLVAEITPPRSMTGLGLDHLRDRKTFDAWREAADRVLAEMRK